MKMNINRAMTLFPENFFSATKLQLQKEIVRPRLNFQIINFFYSTENLIDSKIQQKTS